MFFFEKEIMALLQSHFSKENLEIEKNYLYHVKSIQADTLWFIRVELSWSLEKKMISRSNSKSHFENLSHFLKFYTHSDAKEGIILMWGLGDFQRGGGGSRTGCFYVGIPTRVCAILMAEESRSTLVVMVRP